MPVLLQSYRHVLKPNEKGKEVPFTPLRAVGLAVEAAHKLAREQGRGQVSAEGVAQVSVSGAGVRVWDEGRWRAIRKCQLELDTRDAQLACDIFGQHRSFLYDLGLNIWFVDLSLGRQAGSLDLVCDFSVDNSFGVAGRLWVELKVFSAQGFDGKFQDHQDICSAKFPQVRERDPTIEGTLLLVSRCSRDGPRQWSRPSLHAKLFSHGSWRDIGSRRKATRGRVRGAKPSLAVVWKKMEWYEDPRGGRGKVGLLGHFLTALQLTPNHATDRAPHFNELIAGSGLNLAQIKFPNREGKPPWAGTKAVFRAIYKAL